MFTISQRTLADANEQRDWRIYADFAQALIKIARHHYAEEDPGLDLDNIVYTLDASTIDLCLPVFSWALFSSTKSVVKECSSYFMHVCKLHTLLDLRGNILTFLHISDGKVYDVMDKIALENQIFFGTFENAIKSLHRFTSFEPYSL